MKFNLRCVKMSNININDSQILPSETRSVQSVLLDRNSSESISLTSVFTHYFCLTFRVILLYILQVIALLLFPVFLVLKIFYAIFMILVLFGFIIGSFSYAVTHFLTCSRRNISIILNLNGTEYILLDTNYIWSERRRKLFFIQIWITFEHIMLLISLISAWKAYKIIRTYIYMYVL